MRFAATAVTLFAVITSAMAQYPACTTPCFANPNYDSCVPSNLQCLCTNQVFISNTTTCIYAACNGTDLQQALTTAQQVCAKLGIALTSTPSKTATSVVSPTAKGGASTTSYSALLGLTGAAALVALWI